jgi:hypothetical protein
MLNRDESLTTVNLNCDSCLWPPEYRLMLAVLEDALVTYQYGLRSVNPLRRRRSCEVERWIASTESDGPFSFESICTALHLDPDYIRAGLVQLKHKVYSDQPMRRRIRLRRQPAEGLSTPRGTIANDANESRRRAAACG